MRKYISKETIKLEKSVIIGLQSFCKEKGLDPHNLFIYYDSDGGVHAGFEADESNHVYIEEQHWAPLQEKH